jgi:uncharacterized membrane protein YjgN (DUF898 family)
VGECCSSERFSHHACSIRCARGFFVVFVVFVVFEVVLSGVELLTPVQAHAVLPITT